MASGFGLRHALPATRARVSPQTRTVLTRATIAEPVVVKREGASHPSLPVSYPSRQKRTRSPRKPQTRRFRADAGARALDATDRD